MAFDASGPVPRSRDSRARIRIRARQPARSGRWLVGVGLSVCLHLAPLAILGGYWISRPSPPPPAPVFEVELVRFEAPPEPVSEQPPGPKQVEAKAQPPAPKPPIRPRLFASAPSDVEPLVIPPPQALADPAPQRPVAPETTAPPSRPAPPANKPASAPSWEGQLLAHLEQHKRYPRDARSRRLEGVVLVRFAMNRQGRVLSAVVEQSSDHAVLDRAALDLLRRAQPLPPPPAQVAGDPLTLTVPVEFFQHRR